MIFHSYVNVYQRVQFPNLRLTKNVLVGWTVGLSVFSWLSYVKVQIAAHCCFPYWYDFWASIDPFGLCHFSTLLLIYGLSPPSTSSSSSTTSSTSSPPSSSNLKQPVYQFQASPILCLWVKIRKISPPPQLPPRAQGRQGRHRPQSITIPYSRSQCG